ncbi:MAG TPA: hypothetical protein VFS09_06230 [Candidatus Eisenbacteria bacterium]|nr:hypothetical protein [Candidatus Eisenbacteria bacterium]
METLHAREGTGRSFEEFEMSWDEKDVFSGAMELSPRRSDLYGDRDPMEEDEDLEELDDDDDDDEFDDEEEEEEDDYEEEDEDFDDDDEEETDEDDSDGPY